MYRTSTGRMSVKLTRKKSDFYGKYVIDDETDFCQVTINPGACRSLVEMIDTCIHEYIHHLQPIEREYNEFFKKGFTEDDHPFEIEARAIAADDCWDCRNWVLYKLKQHENAKRRGRNVRG